MTYDSRETSQYSGLPFELYLFLCGGTQWALTSSDEPRSYRGAIYLPEAMKRTATNQGAELQSGTITVTLPKENDIAQLFLPFIPPSPMFLTIYRGHDGEPETEVIVNFTGKVTGAKFADFCELTCAPEQEVLKKTIPAARYQKPCNRILYDDGCTVDKQAFRVDAVLASVAHEVIRSAAFAAKPNGWFDAGTVEHGEQVRMVANHVGDTITLLEAMPDLAAGDTVSAFAGCMRDYDTCRSKFANGEKFFGFEWIPGQNPFKDGIT